MKKKTEIALILFLFCLLNSKFGFSQQTSDYSISFENLNAVYKGVPNYIRICSDKQIIVKIDSGQIEKIGDRYKISIQKTGIRELRIYEKLSNDSIKLIGTKKLIGKSIPTPIAYIVSIGERELTHSEIINQDRLKLMFPTDYQFKYTIVGFSMSYGYSGLDVDIKSTSDSLSIRQKRSIRNCPVGTKIYFEDIKVKIDSTDDYIFAPIIVVKVKGLKGALNYSKDSSNYFEECTSGQRIPKYFLERVDSIYAISEDEEYNKKTFVKSFSLVLKDKEYNSNTNKLTPEMKNAIRKLKRNKDGTELDIVFRNIEYLEDEGNKTFAEKLLLTVTFETKRELLRKNR